MFMEETNGKLKEQIKSIGLWKYNNSKYHVQTSESGLHSDLYLNTDYVVSNASLVESIVKNIFIKELNLRKVKPDWIITYPPFGLTIAYELARQIGARFGYVETKTKLCNFDIKKDEKVIVVGDDIYSGGSIKKTIEIVNNLGAIVKSPIFTIGNFSGTHTLLDLEVVSAISERGNLYKEEECPMCRVNSKSVLPRQNWNKLLEK